jgi:hypothetical protein
MTMTACASRCEARTAVTLVEVLVAIFVMAIGMLALLTLFPIGALSFGQALKDDRCANAVYTANALANARDVRTDSTVQTALDTPPSGYTVDVNGPSFPVIVDPLGVINGYGTTLGAATGTPGISRCSVSYVGSSTSAAARWFSVLDDMVFGTAGVPASTSLDRPGRYTWSYLVRRPRSSQTNIVDLWIVVYYNRSTGVVDGEHVFSASGTEGERSLTLNWASGVKPAVRRNTWILDVSYDAVNLVHGDFYRVVGATESGSTTVCELEVPLKRAAATQQFVVMENVAEVFYKGSGGQP